MSNGRYTERAASTLRIDKSVSPTVATRKTVDVSVKAQDTVSRILTSGLNMAGINSFIFRTKYAIEQGRYDQVGVDAVNKFITRTNSHNISPIEAVHGKGYPAQIFVNSVRDIAGDPEWVEMESIYGYTAMGKRDIVGVYACAVKGTGIEPCWVNGKKMSPEAVVIAAVVYRNTDGTNKVNAMPVVVSYGIDGDRNYARFNYKSYMGNLAEIEGMRGLSKKLNRGLIMDFRPNKVTQAVMKHLLAEIVSD